MALAKICALITIILLYLFYNKYRVILSYCNKCISISISWFICYLNLTGILESPCIYNRLITGILKGYYMSEPIQDRYFSDVSRTAIVLIAAVALVFSMNIVEPGKQGSSKVRRSQNI